MRVYTEKEKTEGKGGRGLLSAPKDCQTSLRYPNLGVQPRGCAKEGARGAACQTAQTQCGRSNPHSRHPCSPPIRGHLQRTPIPCANTYTLRSRYSPPPIPRLPIAVHDPDTFTASSGKGHVCGARAGYFFDHRESSQRALNSGQHGQEA